MILVIGYGNPGRGDDGIGPLLAERIAVHALPGVDVCVDYQLKVEHALAVTEAAQVVFLDAWIGGTVPFDFTGIAPRSNGDVSSHSLAPGTVLALAETLYGRAPPAWLCAVSGSEFGQMYEGLSREAMANLDRAEAFLLDWIGCATETGRTHAAPSA